MAAGMGAAPGPGFAGEVVGDDDGRDVAAAEANKNVSARASATAWGAILCEFVGVFFLARFCVV